MEVTIGDFHLNNSSGLLDFIDKYFSKSDPNISFGYSNNPLASGDYQTLQTEYGNLERFFNSKYQFASNSKSIDQALKTNNPRPLTAFFAWFVYVPFVMARLMRALVGAELDGEFGVDKAGSKYMRVSENRSDGSYSMVFWRDRKKFASNSYVRMVISPVRFSAITKAGTYKVSDFFDTIKFKVKFRAQNGTSSSDEISFNEITQEWLNNHLKTCGRFIL